MKLPSFFLFHIFDCSPSTYMLFSPDVVATGNDTLFPIGPVVEDANSKMIRHLCDRLGYCEITQAGLLDTSKVIRGDLKEKGEMITYTDLRKRAIKIETDKYCVDDNEKEELDWKTVNEVYQIWETERHVAAERYLFHDTREMLDSLLSTFPDGSMIVGAITNGKASPFQMKSTIHQYFDFCVSGEDEDVFPHRKPSKGIYEAALNKYRDLISKGPQQMTEEQGDSNSNGICWIHVGDDLANDVGGSHKCGAMAIWADLKEDEYLQTASERTSGSSKQQPSWSTLSLAELKKREKLNEKAKSCISAKVLSLKELPATIVNLVNSYYDTKNGH